MKKTVRITAVLAIALVMNAFVSQNNQVVAKNSSDQRERPTFSQILADLDTNEDGKLAESEAKGPLAKDFSEIDTDGDGFISESEFNDAPKPERGGRE